MSSLIALLYALTGGIAGVFGGMMGRTFQERLKWAFGAWVVLTAIVVVLHLAVIGFVSVIA